jgi:hypothetical protein
MGRICQYFCPDACKKSTNFLAAFPIVPMPYGDGSEEIGINTPLDLIYFPPGSLREIKY